jgi:tetratricopeptide (TPR) repeat protein
MLKEAIMKRTIITTLTVIFLNAMVGCQPAETGSGQMLPRQSTAQQIQVDPSQMPEADLVEELTLYRQSYERALRMLVDYYSDTGNSTKLKWALTELKAFEDMPRYNYIIEAAVAGADLRAQNTISDADLLYSQARQLHQQATTMLVMTDEDMLRRARDKYNQIIRRHSSSDKIDDAAYYAGRIYEKFKDYRIAAIYYKRAFQWDSQTPYPARYRAAFILDKRLTRRDEALDLYELAMQKEDLTEVQRGFATRRIETLTESDTTQ